MFELPLIVDIGDSNKRRIFLAATHLLAVMAVFLADLPAIFRGAGLALLVPSVVYYWRASPRIRLRCGQDGALEIWRNNRWNNVRLATSSVVLPGCTVLRIAGLDRRRLRNFVILSDSMPSGDWRKLRVWLRWLAL